MTASKIYRPWVNMPISSGNLSAASRMAGIPHAFKARFRPDRAPLKFPANP